MKLPRRYGVLYPRNRRVIAVLDLEPHPRRPRLVLAISALGNDTFKAEAASVGEYLAAVTGKVLDVLNANIAAAQHPLQSLLALDKCQAAKVIAIDLHQVERQ
jgi:hypothetical protein